MAKKNERERGRVPEGWREGGRKRERLKQRKKRTKPPLHRWGAGSGCSAAEEDLVAALEG